MEALMHLAGYLVAVMATAGIVVGIESLNDRCPYAPFRRGERFAVPIKARSTGLRHRSS